MKQALPHVSGWLAGTVNWRIYVLISAHAALLVHALLASAQIPGRSSRIPERHV